jgi:hypothetical protein
VRSCALRVSESSCSSLGSNSCYATCTDDDNGSIGGDDDAKHGYMRYGYGSMRRRRGSVDSDQVSFLGSLFCLQCVHTSVYDM